MTGFGLWDEIDAREIARDRALERLAREYPERFQVILGEELALIYAPGGHP